MKFITKDILLKSGFDQSEGDDCVWFSTENDMINIRWTDSDEHTKEEWYFEVFGKGVHFEYSHNKLDANQVIKILILLGYELVAEKIRSILLERP